LAIAILALGLVLVHGNAWAQSDMTGACIPWTSSDPLDACRPVDEMTSIASRAAGGLYSATEHDAREVQAMVLDEAAMLCNYWDRRPDSEVIASFEALLGTNASTNPLEALRVSLLSDRSRCTGPRRAVPSRVRRARLEADCELVTGTAGLAREMYDSVRDEVETSSGGAADAHALAEGIRAYLRTASRYGLRDTAARTRDILVDPMVARVRVMMFYGIRDEAERNRIFNNLNFRHYTDSGSPIPNIGYTLGGSRDRRSRERGGRETGDSYDCTDLIGRALSCATGDAPSSSHYMRIGAYLEARGTGRSAVPPSLPRRLGTRDWNGLEDCFDRVAVEDGAFPSAGDIIVKDGHMMLVKNFLPETGTVETVEAASTDRGVVPSAFRRLESFPRPDGCRSTGRARGGPVISRNSRCIHSKHALKSSGPRWTGHMARHGGLSNAGTETRRLGRSPRPAGRRDDCLYS
jgi:hypothetical protein